MGHIVGAQRRALRDTGAPAPASVVHQVDPRTRILAAVLFAIAVVGLDSLLVLLLALAMALAVMLLARQPPRQTLRRMAAMDGFIVFMLLLLPFTVPGDAMFTVFGHPASRQGLLQAVQIALKANAIILMLMALVGSMEPVTLGHALYRLHVPERLIHLLMFTVRYVSVLQEEYARLRVAMKARGFRPASNRHTYRSFGYLVGMMLVRAIERSERILEAMRCRGFTGRLPLLDNLAFTTWDAGFAASFALAVAGLLLAQSLP